jgi:hypothetical protein
MMSKFLVFRFAAAALGSLLSISALAAAQQCSGDGDRLISRPLADQGPTEIATRIYVNDIIRIDDAQQSFTADVFFRVEWQDPRLAHSGSEPCSIVLADIWNPDLQILNRRSIERVRQIDPQVQPDGTVMMAMRGFGDFSFHADLTEFPFDQQVLPFNIVSAYSEDDIRFVIDPGLLSVAPQLSVANWRITVGGARAETQYVAAVDRQLLRLDVLLEASRRTGFYTWQQLVPLLLVVMMTWVVFWIPLEFVAPRVGLAATAMLTLIAYRFAMSSVLPPIAYLTRLDLFMIGASVLVFGSLVVSVAVTWTEHNRSESLAARMNLAACWMSPVLLVGLCVFAFFA